MFGPRFDILLAFAVLLNINFAREFVTQELHLIDSRVSASITLVIIRQIQHRIWFDPIGLKSGAIPLVTRCAFATKQLMREKSIAIEIDDETHLMCCFHDQLNMTNYPFQEP